MNKKELTSSYSTLDLNKLRDNRRYEIARSVLSAWVSIPNIDLSIADGVKKAVAMADALIEELEK
jgi:hypothetical protein